MKLWIWSDVHSELENVNYPASDEMPECDVIIIAGDLQRAPDMLFEAEGLINLYQKPIIFVPGNHEFYQARGFYSDYKRSMESDLRKLKSIEKLSENWLHRFYVLDEDTVILNGVRFIGATLWVDFEMNLQEGETLETRLAQARGMLNDFRAIRMQTGHLFSPLDTLKLHKRNAAYIRKALNTPFEGKTVVITHHMPHEDCTPEFYKGSAGKFLFACSKHAFADILNGLDAPDLWICGHTHQAFDKTIGQTRIVCNPRGYWHEQGKNGFRWDLVFDV